MPIEEGSSQLELWKSGASKPGQQTSLFDDFPEADARENPAEKPQSKFLDQAFASRRPLNILVADDNEINRKVIRVILQKLGYHCVEATNGEEALEQYNTGEYDYIFMDLDMPEMDGISAAQAIREQEQVGEAERSARKTEIIAVTANVSDETRLRCRRAGMNGYLEKPITASMIKDQLLRSWPRIRSQRDGK